MSDIASIRRILGKWRFGTHAIGQVHLVCCAIALALVSLALSEPTLTARAKLWFGPQTVVLGAVGICMGVAVAALAWQSARAGGAELLDRPVLARRGILTIVGACMVLSLCVLYFAFATFPNSADEYVFLFQADTLRHFHLWNAPPADPTLFEQNYIVARNGIWVSQYLPGWPAILALFELARLPPWLAAPVCGALLLLLLWLALRLECRSSALVVALLLAYAASDFFLLNSATYFAHCASTDAVVGSIVCMLFAEQRDESWRWPVAAGACFGFALLCRIDCGALAGIAALGFWIGQGCRRRTLLLGVAGALPLIVVLAVYNWLITGNPLLPPTAWAGEINLGTNGLQGVEASTHFRMLVQTMWRLGELADTASLVVPALYLAALVMRIRSRNLRFYDIVPIANFVIFLIYPDLGGFQMGPRYWFDGFAVMHITIASTLAQRSLPWQRFTVACCLLLVPVSLARLPGLVRFEARLMRERSSMFRLGATLPTDHRSVVLVSDFPSAWNDRANRTTPNLAKDFARNGTQLDKPVLYARGDAPNALERACALYADAAFYAFHLDHAHPQGWLAPLTCNAGAR